MSLASRKGTYSSAASRGLDVQQEEAQRFLKFNKPTPRSEISSSASAPTPIAPSAPSTRTLSSPPQKKEPIAPGTTPTPAQEAGRISQMMNDRRRLPENLSNARQGSGNGYGEQTDGGDNEGGEDGLSDDSVSPEQAASVTDVGQLGNPYGEDVSMQQKAEDANRRQAQAIGRPGTSSADFQTPGVASAAAPSGGSPTNTGRKSSLVERGRESLGQEYGKFQRDLQATKRKDDKANNALKALAASKGSQTLKQVNMLKERFIKLRDLFTVGTGVGIVYYIAKLDITVANRYFLKRTYLWGYREKEEYEGNKLLRLNDNLDLVEWCGWMFIRVIMTLAPIMILFLWVIMPVLAAHELANRILGPTLASYLERIIR